MNFFNPITYINMEFRLKLMISILEIVLCRETILSYLNVGDDVQVLGSLSVLATLLQTKGKLVMLGCLDATLSHKVCRSYL